MLNLEMADECLDFDKRHVWVVTNRTCPSGGSVIRLDVVLESFRVRNSVLGVGQRLAMQV